MVTPAAPDSIPLSVLLMRAGAAYTAAMRSALAEAGFDDLPRNAIYVIGGLALRARACPLSELIDQLMLSKQAMGQLADAMVAGDYIHREVDAADRRRLLVSLTERGRAAARVQAAARKSIDLRLQHLAGATDVERTRRTLALLGNLGRPTGIKPPAGKTP
jgi:DNA-binding MarR family transcriptional regulator